MPRQCPVCSKLNPTDASYCYYDGRHLSRDGPQGPLHVGTMPFPTSFCFSDGEVCANFNQLAIGCNNHWEEARSFLAEGHWPTFFAGLGRLDLAAAARQAAGDPDRDRGLCQLLEKLPADPDCLPPPKVAVQPAEVNLGQLTPGSDRTFELTIVNQGRLFLRGVISSNSEWLVFGSRTGPSQKVFETRNFYSIPVCVVGSRLRAGLMPLHAEITIDSNGGTITVPVQVEVPIRPFPKGLGGNDVLAGARSPRELALKAKEFPGEAAVLFEQAAVKAWYASNGWTYPVEGSHVSGKGAVQQFFEALGLTRAPRLAIDTEFLMLKAKMEEHLTLSLTVRTEEAKPVYAQAWSNQEWVTCGPVKYMGNKVRIPVDIVVPARPGETIQAQITIQGNGKQQFIVPVNVTVEKGSPMAPAAGAIADQRDGSTADWWLRWGGWFAGGFVITIILLLIVRRLF